MPGALHSTQWRRAFPINTRVHPGPSVDLPSLRFPSSVPSPRHGGGQGRRPSCAWLVAAISAGIAGMHARRSLGVGAGGTFVVAACRHLRIDDEVGTAAGMTLPRRGIDIRQTAVLLGVA